jgi:hypothetical protein
MLSWFKRRRRPEPSVVVPPVEPAVPQGLGMSKAFVGLYDHLRNRYADTVVLTFSQMEDVLGAPLPASARRDLAWWNSETAENFEHTNAWRLASRSAVANLMAQTVMFDRA